MKPELYMPAEMTIAELVHPQVTGADLDYIGSITIAPEALAESGLLPGEMVYIDTAKNTKAKTLPPWRTYIVPGKPGQGETVMNGPPAFHFSKGDPLTIRAGALIPFADMPKMANGHTEVYFTQDQGAPNQVVSAKTKRVEIPANSLRKMCISKLHRIMITSVSTDGPEMLIVDADILEKAGFPAGIEAQFTSLANGALRRTSVQAGPRGTGLAEIRGSGAQYVPVGTRVVSLAEVWLPYSDAVKVTTGPQVVFFDESPNLNINVVREVKPGWRPA